MGMDAKVKELLETPFVPSCVKPNVFYSRFHDDSDKTNDEMIGVSMDRFGDVYVSTNKKSQLRFRTRGGGGNSLRVRNALLILAEAIRLDNEEKS